MTKKREITTIGAVHYDELPAFFQSLGLLDDLREGKIRCLICGRMITPESFKAATRKGDQLLFCCSREPCIGKLASRELEFTSER